MMKPLPLLEQCLIHIHRGIPGWIAFSCKDGHHVSSGETIIKCAEMIDKVRPITGIGINCT